MTNNNDPDDLDLQQYQDDLDSDPKQTDDILDEETDSPSDTLLVPDEKLVTGPPESMSLDSLATDELEHSSDNLRNYDDREDSREDIEDKDQGD